MVRVNIIQGDESRKAREHKNARKRLKLKGHGPRHKMVESSSLGHSFAANPPEGLETSVTSHTVLSPSVVSSSSISRSTVHQNFQPSELRTTTITNYQNFNFIHPVNRPPVYQTAHVMNGRNIFTVQQTTKDPAFVTAFPNLISGQNRPYYEEGQTINEVHMRYFHPEKPPQSSKRRCYYNTNVNPSFQLCDQGHQLPTTSGLHIYQAPLRNSGIQLLPSSEGIYSNLMESLPVDFPQDLSAGWINNYFAELLSDFIVALPDELLGDSAQELPDDSPKDPNHTLQEDSSANHPQDHFAVLPENGFPEFLSLLPDELLDYSSRELSADSSKDVKDHLPEVTSVDSPKDLSEHFADLLADFFGFPKDHFVDVCPTVSDLLPSNDH